MTQAAHIFIAILLQDLTMELFLNKYIFSKEDMKNYEDVEIYALMGRIFLYAIIFLNWDLISKLVSKYT